MGVVLTHDVAHHPGRLHVRPIKGVVELVHGEQHATMHGLQAIAHVRQRPADDDAHGVVEVRLPELVFDVYRKDVAAVGAAACRTIATGTITTRPLWVFRLVPGCLIRLQF